MRRLRAFGRFWYDFVVGDDWRVALTVALALAITFIVNVLTEAGVWWIVTGAVIAVLPLSIRRATRSQRQDSKAERA